MKRNRTIKMLVMVLVLSFCMPAAGGNAVEARAKRNTFGSNGKFYDSEGHALQKSTILHFLQTALKPVGKTLYIWGGGHGAGVDTTYGVLPQWEKFFKSKGKNYDYRNYRWQLYNGLDCSGYVGWALYNTFNTESGHGSLTMLAQDMAYTYGKSWKWGKYRSARKFKNQKAGDIMSLAAGHVYIVVGRCSDGSLVILHSSPRGVMINGTVSKTGKSKSKAWKLAKKYMKKYYPAWMKKFKKTSELRRGYSYLTSYSQMQWYTDRENSIMSDPEGLRKMSADKVLKVLFNE